MFATSHSFFNYFSLIFQISIVQWLNCQNLKDELNRSYNGGGVVYLPQSEASYSSIQYIFLGLCETSCIESSERLWGRSVCSSEPGVVRSITEEYFVKYSSSEGTDIGASDRNWTWGLCCHHDYISLRFLWGFVRDSYSYEESQTQKLSRVERYRLLCRNLSRC